jgi:cytochrome c oxidase subunit 2
MTRRRSLALAVILLVLVLPACSSSFGMPRGANDQGRDIFRLWQIMFVASVIVAAVIYGLIAYSVIRYRGRGRTDVIRDRRDHPVLEIVYTAIPVVIVAVLWFLSWQTNKDVVAVASERQPTVRVQAFSWGWRFTYPSLGVTVVSTPSGGPPQMVLPLGETSTIELTSADVIHAWYVPAFLYKHDAIPGRVATFDITPEETGVFPGACAEFCGLNHAYMRFSVRVVPAAEFAEAVGRAAGFTNSASITITPMPSATASATAAPTSSATPSASPSGGVG